MPTKIPEPKVNPQRRRMAGGNGSIIAGRRTVRADHVRAARDEAGAATRDANATPEARQGLPGHQVIARVARADTR